MKMDKSLINRLFYYSFILLITFSCSPDDGQDGAQGPEGPAGPQGETGTANVIYSGWLPSQFTSPSNSQLQSYPESAPQLTQEIMDSGVFLVYGRRSSGLVYQLPVRTFGNQNYQFSFDTPGEFSLTVFTENATLGDLWIDGEFRYIIIPGGNPAGGKNLNLPNFNKMTYEEVVEYFNIPI